MKFNPKFSSGLWVFAGCMDRFCPSGYSKSVGVKEQIKLAGKVQGLKGIECHQSDFDQISRQEFKRLLKKNNLSCSNVNVNVWGSAKWKHGAFAHQDKRIRKEAIEEAKKAVRIAREIGSPSIGLWLGADGFDYPFQINYFKQWDYLLSSIREVGEYAQPDIKVGIEYKLKEPRTHMTIGSAGKTLAICLELGLENVGAVIDFGHALMSREDPAESLVLLSRHHKLFNVHLNDAYREWDDDLIVGVVHLWETLEFLYYCVKTSYQGWLGLDMFPYREDGVKAATMSIKNIKALLKMVEKIDFAKLERAQRTMGALKTQEVIRKVVF